MSEVSQRFRDWWQRQSDFEKIKHVREHAILLRKYHYYMTKAANDEAAFQGTRTGIRGGRQTTITAKAEQATKLYLSTLCELKYMISTL